MKPGPFVASSVTVATVLSDTPKKIPKPYAVWRNTSNALKSPNEIMNCPQCKNPNFEELEIGGYCPDCCEVGFCSQCRTWDNEPHADWCPANPDRTPCPKCNGYAAHYSNGLIDICTCP